MAQKRRYEVANKSLTFLKVHCPKDTTATNCNTNAISATKVDKGHDFVPERSTAARKLRLESHQVSTNDNTIATQVRPRRPKLIITTLIPKSR